MNQLFLTIIIAIILLLNVRTSKIEGEVIAQLKSGSVSVMVKFKDQIEDSFLNKIKNFPIYERRKLLYNTLTGLALKTQKDVVKFLDSNNLFYKRHYIVNAIYVKSVDEEAVRKLAQFKEVNKIFLVPKFSTANTLSGLHRTTPTKLSNSNAISKTLVEPNISYVGADRVWNEFTDGSGIVIASQDTGAEWTHPALVNQYRGSSGTAEVRHDFNWYDAVDAPLTSVADNPCGYSSKEPCDDLSHGTHVLGIAVGGDGTNFIGVAPGALWIACRNKDIGIGNISTYFSCFEFFSAPYKMGDDPLTDGDISKAPHIVTNSWSCPESEGCREDEFLDVLKILKTAGIFVVVSAGNSGPDCSSINNTPASHSDYSFSVGAVFHETGQIWHSSSRGPSFVDNKVVPHIVAPGLNIRSSISDGQFGNSWYGSSMATPHVAGAVALIWASNKNLIGKIDETAQILKDTAIQKFAHTVCGNNKNTIPNNTYGYGILNVYEAVKQANL